MPGRTRNTNRSEPLKATLAYSKTTKRYALYQDSGPTHILYVSLPWFKENGEPAEIEVTVTAAE